MARAITLFWKSLKVKLATKYQICGDGDSFCNDILWLIILASIQVGIGGLQVIAAFVACFCVTKSSGTKVVPDDEAKEIGEETGSLKPEVMELVEVENENETKSEVDSDESDVSEENDDNNEDGEDSEKSDDEKVDRDVDEKPEDKAEDIIPESEEVNYTNKDRRRTTIISIDKEELEDIFKDNTIDEEDVEVPEDKSEAGSDDNEDAEDTDEDNEGLWLRF